MRKIKLARCSGYVSVIIKGARDILYHHVIGHVK